MLKAFIIPIAFLAAGAAAVMLYGLPYYEDVKALHLERRGYDSALATADEVARVTAELRSKYEELSEEEHARLEAMLPLEAKAIENIIEINNLANANGVTVSSITPSDSEETGEGVGIPAQYETLQVEYALVADYNSFLSFLEDLERRLRITDITSVSFSTPEDSSFYEIEVAMETYWINEN